MECVPWNAAAGHISFPLEMRARSGVVECEIVVHDVCVDELYLRSPDLEDVPADIFVGADLLAVIFF